MPIKGLSERRRMPRLGKIRTGIKVSGGKSEYPKATDYFVLPDDEYGKKLAEVFGEKPKELRVVFPVDDLNVVASQWYKCYRSGVGLDCKGDGEHATRVEEGSGKLVEIECPCERLEGKQCKQMLNLVFMVPEVSMAGVFQIDTSSFNSIVDINSGLDFVRSVRGKLAMEPCILRLNPREVSPGGKKKTVYTMSIVPAEEEARSAALLPMAGVATAAPQIEAPANKLGAGHVEEQDLVPASVQDVTAEVVEPDPPDDFDPSEQIGPAAADALLTEIKAAAKAKSYSLKKLLGEVAKKYDVKKLGLLTIAQRDQCEEMLREWGG